MGRVDRRIVQPGPAMADRLVVATGQVERLDLTLEMGKPLGEAIAEPLIRAGFKAAAVEISGGAFGPFHYVIPAPAPDATHAAWYSETHIPLGGAHLEAGNVTFGFKDGAPFIHCHALWQEAEGRRGGHVLPGETVVCAPISAIAYGTREVEMVAEPDPETNFTLLAPRQVAPSSGSPRIAFIRVRPNEDLCGALDQACRRLGFPAGRVRGSLGSLVGARFSDGKTFEDYATEVLVREGSIIPRLSGGLEVRLDVAMAGLSGALAEGRLMRGENPVLITFEVAVEEIL